MRIDRRELFRQLEPPPGGVERMRARAMPSGMHVSRFQWRAVACAMVALVAIILVVGRGPRGVSTDGVISAGNTSAGIAVAPQFDRLLGRTPAPVDLTVTQNDQAVALTRVEGSNPKVRMYALVRLE